MEVHLIFQIFTQARESEARCSYVTRSTSTIRRRDSGKLSQKIPNLLSENKDFQVRISREKLNDTTSPCGIPDKLTKLVGMTMSNVTCWVMVDRNPSRERITMLTNPDVWADDHCFVLLKISPFRITTQNYSDVFYPSG